MSIASLSKIIFFGVIFVVILYSGFLVFFTWPIDEFSINKAGSFGDSFGLLTSIFSGLAFAGMIITILLQREELKLQRIELSQTRVEISEQKKIFKNQSFNESFYRLLDYHKKNLSELSIFSDEDKMRLKGVDALRFLLKRLKKGYSDYGFQGFDFNNKDLSNDMVHALFHEVQVVLIRQSRYLETIVSIFSLINTQLEDESEKEVYRDLLASQLTIYELQYIFYQCLVAKPNDKLRGFVHEARLYSERGQDIGVSNTHRSIYSYIHEVEVPKYKEILYFPFERKIVRKAKRSNKIRKGININLHS